MSCMITLTMSCSQNPAAIISLRTFSVPLVSAKVKCSVQSALSDVNRNALWPPPANREVANLSFADQCGHRRAVAPLCVSAFERCDQSWSSNGSNTSISMMRFDALPAQRETAYRSISTWPVDEVTRRTFDAARSSRFVFLLLACRPATLVEIAKYRASIPSSV